MTINVPRTTRRLCWSLTVVAGLVTACGSSDSSDFGEYSTGVDAASGDVLYAWVQYGDSGPEARAIVNAGVDCPDADVDGVMTPMSERAGAAEGFGAVSCSIAVDPTAGTVEVGEKPLPNLTAAPERILVLGDTGCRMSPGWFENCDGSGTGTPWSFVAAAQAAAAEQPDLIVHVGDYVYREAECDDAAQPGCAGSPWGDNWATWETDFFAPSGDLLDTAPWIVTRGNHEDCGRNHVGWLRFLDGRAITASDLTVNGCPQFSAPYGVTFTDVDFLVLNTATDPTTTGLDPTPQARYTADFTAAAAKVTAGRPAWTVTHRPFWGVAPDWQDPTKLGAVDPELQAAIADMPGGAWPEEVDMSLAGHIHLLETLSFTDGRPHQVVSGDAGTAQDSAITDAAIAGNAEVFTALGMSADDFESFHDFGYAIIEPASAGGWTVTVKSIDGDMLEQFSLR